MRTIFAALFILLIAVAFPIAVLAQGATLDEVFADLANLGGLGGVALAMAVVQILIKLTKVTALRQYWDQLGEYKAWAVLALSIVIGTLEHVTVAGGGWGAAIVVGLTAAFGNAGWKQYTKVIYDKTVGGSPK